MILYDMQDFGGLEEYLATLAIGLRSINCETSVFSFAWVADDNQYKQRLVARGVPFVQVPRWLSLPASDWSTKMRLLKALMRLATPLVLGLAAAHSILKRQTWSRSLQSARGWMSGRFMRYLAPDRRESIGRLMLSWWRWRWRPDLLHIQGYTTNLLFAVDWAHAKRLPVVYEEHQTPDPQFDWWKDFSHTINKATRVVAVSERSARALQDVCGITRPIAVRPPLLPDPVAPGWVRREPRRLDDRPPVVASVARLGVTKGISHLLDAIVLVRSTHPTTQFQIHGDGPLHGELRDYATSLGLDADAIFRGAFTSRDELGQILANADVFVMSSILEGQPLGLVEAMAYGCPIVATTVGGIPELIEDGVNGYLCPPGNAVSLAQRLRLMLDDPERRRRMGHAARHSYERGGFQPPAVCSHLAAIYASALEMAHADSR
jgi:glycosyltransferase involved in cell wall biosynthesis